MSDEKNLISKLHCNHCLKDFKSRQGLVYHNKHHVCNRQKKSTQCEKCKKEFKTVQAIEYHIANSVCYFRPLVIQSSPICVLCGHNFSSKRALQSHTDKKICIRQHEQAFQSVSVQCVQGTQDQNTQDQNTQDQNTQDQNTQDTQNSQGTQNSQRTKSAQNTQNISNNGTIINGNNQTVNFTCNYNGVPFITERFTSVYEKGKQLPFSSAIDTRFLTNLGAIVQESLAKHNNTIKHTIQNINCNPHNPLYNNIYTNKSLLRYSMCEIFNGTTYDGITKEESIEKLIKSHIDLINQYIANNKHIFNSEEGKRNIEQYKAYVASLNSQNERGTKSKTKRALEKDVLVMLINIGKTINTPEWSDNLQKQYLTYCQKETLRSEMLKDQTTIIKQFGIDTKIFGLLVYDSIDKCYDAAHPAINSALECIESGSKVDWEKIFDISI